MTSDSMTHQDIVQAKALELLINMVYNSAHGWYTYDECALRETMHILNQPSL